MAAISKSEITPQQAQGLDVSGSSGAAESAEIANASLNTNFQKIGRFHDQSQVALSNARKQQIKKRTDVRVISDAGFRSIAGFPTTTSTPSFRYSPPPTAVERAEKDVILNVVFQSFGSEHDLAALNNNNAQSVSVDPATGHSVERFNLGLKSFTGNKTSSIHHIVSRNGDLVNSVSWDQLGRYISNSAIRPSIQSRSIGVALEARFRRHSKEVAQRFNLNQKTLDPVLNLAPFTERQYFVCAFILKKLKIWLGNDDILSWLGAGSDTISALQSQAPGCVNYVDAASKPSSLLGPNAEFLLPTNYKKGDPLPSHLSGDPRWEKRIAIFYEGVPNGTLLSAWGRIFEKVEAIREYNLASEIFDTSIANEILDVTAPTISGAVHVAAAEKTGANKVNQYRRATLLQDVSRANFFSKSTANAETSSAVMRRRAAQIMTVSESSSSVPIIEEGLCFNYETGQWERDTTINIPGDNQISRNKLSTVQTVAMEDIMIGEAVKGKKRLECDVYRGSYSKVNVAAFMYDTFVAVRDEIRAAGAIFTSSGALRSISVGEKKRADGTTKKPISLHQAGLALDLNIKTGMQNPETDPYVITREGALKWRVYGRCSANGVGAQRLTLPGVAYANGALNVINVEDYFIDITAVFAKYGFTRISARKSFANPRRRKYLSAEWWHFQNEARLQAGVTTYGDMLRIIYSEKRLQNAPVSPYLDYRFRGGNFRVA